MKLYSVRLLVDDFTACFEFYQNVLDLKAVWGDKNGPYADFRVGDSVMLALFRRDLMSKAVGTAALPKNATRQDKSLVVLQVDDVDQAYEHLTNGGATFINAPRDYPDWTIRAVHLRDPDGNLVELFSPLAREQWTDEVRVKDRETAASGQ